MKKVKLLLAALAMLSFAAACTQKEEIAQPLNEAVFALETSSVTATGATVNVSVTVNKSATWYGFLTQDLESKAADLVKETIGSLNVSRHILKTGSQDIEITDLRPGDAYRYIVTGLIANGTTYNTPVDITFITVGDFQPSETWTVTYDGINSQNRPVISVAGTSGDYIFQVLPKAAFQETYDSDFGKFANAYVNAALAGTISKDTETADKSFRQDKLEAGDYVAIAFGVDTKHFYPTLEYASAEFTVAYDPDFFTKDETIVIDYTGEAVIVEESTPVTKSIINLAGTPAKYGFAVYSKAEFESYEYSLEDVAAAVEEEAEYIRAYTAYMGTSVSKYIETEAGDKPQDLFPAGVDYVVMVYEVDDEFYATGKYNYAVVGREPITSEASYEDYLGEWKVEGALSVWTITEKENGASFYVDGILGGTFNEGGVSRIEATFNAEDKVFTIEEQTLATYGSWNDMISGACGPEFTLNYPANAAGTIFTAAIDADGKLQIYGGALIAGPVTGVAFGYYQTGSTTGKLNVPNTVMEIPATLSKKTPAAFTKNEAWTASYLQDYTYGSTTYSVVGVEGITSNWAYITYTATEFAEVQESIADEINYEAYAAKDYIAYKQASPASSYYTPEETYFMDALYAKGVDMVVVMYGVDEEFNPTGEYGCATVTRPAANAQYSDYIGTWKDENEVSYEIVQNVEDESYFIMIEGTTVTGEWHTYPALTFDPNGKTIALSEQVFNTWTHSTYGQIDEYLSGIFTYGSASYKYFGPNSDTPEVIFYGTFDGESGIDIEPGSCPYGTFTGFQNLSYLANNPGFYNLYSTTAAAMPTKLTKVVDQEPTAKIASQPAGVAPILKKEKSAKAPSVTPGTSEAATIKGNFSGRNASVKVSK